MNPTVYRYIPAAKVLHGIVDELEAIFASAEWSDDRARRNAEQACSDIRTAIAIERSASRIRWTAGTLSSIVAVYGNDVGIPTSEARADFVRRITDTADILFASAPTR